MVKIKESSLEKKVKENELIESSSEEDDFFLILWSVCHKQSRFFHTKLYTKLLSRVQYNAE